jgi:hypothetical protein
VRHQRLALERVRARVRQRGVSLMESQQHVTDMGGTMRLGAYPCRLARGTRARAAYGGRGERAPPAPLRGVEPLPRHVRAPRAAAQRALARRLARRDRGARRPPLVPRLPVPPRSCSRARRARTRSSPAFVGAAARAARAAPAHARARRRTRGARRGARTAAARRASSRRDALFLIAGPCQLEDDALNLRVAEHVARLAERVPGGSSSRPASTRPTARTPRACAGRAWSAASRRSRS